MKDWRVLPKIVLFEGINLSGKTTLINQFKERYPKQIEIIKFPRQPRIIESIIHLYRKISETKERTEIYQYLEIIHQLFDLDFRQFTTEEQIRDLSKVYFLDRYYPSNSIYAGLHMMKQNPYWIRCHEMKPDMVIFLEVRDEKSYIKNFPVYDNTVEIELENKIKLSAQLLTPQLLIEAGQPNYRFLFNKLKENKLIEDWVIINALQEDTFRNTERILMRDQIL